MCGRRSLGRPLRVQEHHQTQRERAPVWNFDKLVNCLVLDEKRKIVHRRTLGHIDASSLEPIRIEKQNIDVARRKKKDQRRCLTRHLLSSDGFSEEGRMVDGNPLAGSCDMWMTQDALPTSANGASYLRWKTTTTNSRLLKAKSLVAQPRMLVAYIFL